MADTEETPILKAKPEVAHSNSGFVPLVLLSILYITSGAYTTVTVFTGDGIAKQPGFGQKTVHMGETMLWLGAAVSTAAFLPLFDIYGRRDLLYLAGVLGLTSAAIALLASSPWLYLAAQFGIGVFLFPTGLTAWVLAAESVSPKIHNRMLAVWNICYSLFGVTMAACSFGINHTSSMSWRLESIFWYVPIVASLMVGPLYVSESPEMMAGKSDRIDRNESSLRVWPMVGYLVATAVCWSAVSMSFYALSYSSSSLSPDIYLNMALLAGIDCVVYGCALPIIDWLSPKWAQFTSLSCAAALMLFCSTLPPKSWAMMSICLLGRMCVDVAFSTIFLLIVEVFPAPIRATAMGFSNVVARVCTAFAPLLALSPAWACCLVVVGATSAAALATWTLPQKNRLRGEV